MEKNQILQAINEIFCDVLDNDTIILSFGTTADEIEEWDSLTHIQLVVAVEKKFQIRFNSSEIQSWNNLGEMIDCIVSKEK